MSNALQSARNYVRLLGVRGLAAALRGRVVRRPSLLTASHPDLRAPVVMRVPSADSATYRQILVRREYDYTATVAPRTIVDGGAHIGLASVWFASRYPDARIIAVEPEDANFDLLLRNARPYPNVEPLHAALWGTDMDLEVVDPGLGTWGYMTAPAGARSRAATACQRVRGLTLDRLMREHGLDAIDVLKLDIEGAEREVFAAPGPWLARTDLIIAELHERLKTGCNRAFYQATGDFDHEWCRGENVFVARLRAGAMPAAGAVAAPSAGGSLRLVNPSVQRPMAGPDRLDPSRTRR